MVLVFYKLPKEHRTIQTTCTTFWACSRQTTPRIVKIFELAFPLEVTPLPLPMLRFVFRSTLPHTQCQSWTTRAEGGSDGLETPARIYHGDCRSGTAATQRVLGD